MAVNNLTNNFKVHGQETDNKFTDAEYLSNAERVDGYQPGSPTSSKSVNTALRQSTLLATSLIDALKVISTGNLTTPLVVGADTNETQLTTALQQLLLGIKVNQAALADNVKSGALVEETKNARNFVKGYEISKELNRRLNFKNTWAGTYKNNDVVYYNVVGQYKGYYVVQGLSEETFVANEYVGPGTITIAVNQNPSNFTVLKRLTYETTIGDDSTLSKTDSILSTSISSQLATAKGVWDAIKNFATKTELTTGLSAKVDATTYTTGLATKLDVSTYNTGIATKVDKDGSKVLSDNNYTTAEKNKLAALPTNAALSTSLANKIDTSKQLGTTNLDTLNKTTDQGFWNQQVTANATLARNYPVAITGSLEIIASAHSLNNVTQRYTTISGRTFTRTISGGSWTKWNELATFDDIQKYGERPILTGFTNLSPYLLAWDTRAIGSTSRQETDTTGQSSKFTIASSSYSKMKVLPDNASKSIANVTFEMSGTHKDWLVAYFDGFSLSSTDYDAFNISLRAIDPTTKAGIRVFNQSYQTYTNKKTVQCKVTFTDIWGTVKSFSTEVVFYANI